MSKILSRLTSSAGIQQSVMVIFGNMLSTGLAALALILLSRLLGPARFGAFSVGVAVATILSKANDLGLSYAVIKLAGSTKKQTDLNAFFSESLKIKILGCGLTILVGLIGGQWLSDFLGLGNPMIIYLSFILSSVIVMFEQVQAMFLAMQRFTQSVVLMMAQALIKLVVALALYTLNQSPTVLLLVLYLASPAVSLILTPQLSPRDFHLNLARNFFRERASLLNIARHSFTSIIATTLIENVDILFVQYSLSSYEAGLFGGVSRLALFFNIIAFSIGSVLNSRVAKYHSFNDRQKFMRKAIISLFLVLIGFLIIVPLSSLLITLTIGTAYLPALTTLLILNGAAFLTIAATPFVALFFSLRAPWYFSVVGIIQIMIIILGNTLFVPQFGIEAAAWTRVVARLSLLIITIGLSTMLINNKTSYTKNADSRRN